MTHTRIFARAAAALLAACNGLMTDPQRTGVMFEADRQAYTPQDEIVTSLINNSEDRVGYNLCGSPLEMRTSGGWIRVARNPEGPCIQPLYSLQPGESATFREPASHMPGPGTYRLRTRIETPIPGEWRDVVTDPFIVQ